MDSFNRVFGFFPFYKQYVYNPYPTFRYSFKAVGEPVTKGCSGGQCNRKQAPKYTWVTFKR